MLLMLLAVELRRRAISSAMCATFSMREVELRRDWGLETPLPVRPGEDVRELERCGPGTVSEMFRGRPRCVDASRFPEAVVLDRLRVVGFADGTLDSSYSGMGKEGCFCGGAKSMAISGGDIVAPGLISRLS